MLLLPILFCSAAPGQKTTTVDVTALVHDYDAAGTQLLTRSDDHNNQQAAYTDTANAAGTGGVSTRMFLSNGGEWQMYLGNQASRTICLTLSPVDLSQKTPVPDGCYSAGTEVWSRCMDASNQPTGLLAIAPGTANNRCELGVNFSYNKVGYQLIASPWEAYTGWASVSCNAGGTSCSNWTIVPNPNTVIITDANGGVTQKLNPFPLRARLYQFTKTGQKVLVGDYYNTYRIDLSIP